MTALMLVLMMPVAVHVLVGMHPRLMAVLVPVMGVGEGLVAMLMLMTVLVMAAHPASPPFFLSLHIF
jgi:hypothetical protein